jgi:hypothetical protein
MVFQTISNENQVSVGDHNASPLHSESKPGKESRIHRKRILVIILAVVALVIAGAYFAWNAFQYEDTDDAQVDGHVMPLSPRVNGHIKAVYVDEGQLVHARLSGAIANPCSDICPIPRYTRTIRHSCRHRRSCREGGDPVRYGLR